MDPNGTYIRRMGCGIEVVPIPFESIQLSLPAKPEKVFPYPLGKRSFMGVPTVRVGGSEPINVW